MNAPKIYLTIILNFFPLLLYCQLYEWTAASPLTDSLSDNKNAIVKELKINSDWDHYVVWEKSFDSSSTSIYARKYYSDDEPVAWVDDGNHNTDPCVFDLAGSWDDDPPGDTTFYLVYLSDVNGNYDLFYLKYCSTGFSGPYSLTQTPGDEKHLRSNGINGLTWEYEGAIKSIGLEQVTGSAFAFSEIMEIDSGNCRNPVIETIAGFGYYPYHVAYEKVIDGWSKVMLCQYEIWNNTWGIPEVVYDSGNNINLRFSESSFDDTSITLSWDNVDDAGQTRIFCYGLYEADFYISEYSQPSEFMPATFNIFVGVSDIWGFTLLSFMLNENGQGDIYGGYLESWFPDGYSNLSLSSVTDINPHLWNGLYYYDYQDVIDVWESNRNEHWQLWTSKTQVPLSGGINERAGSQKEDLKIFPNPFSEFFTVNYHSGFTGKGRLVISDLTGIRTNTVIEVNIKEGENNWKTDPLILSVSSFPDGMYAIQLEFMNKIISNKIIKIKY